MPNGDNHEVLEVKARRPSDPSRMHLVHMNEGPRRSAAYHNPPKDIRYRIPVDLDDR